LILDQLRLISPEPKNRHTSTKGFSMTDTSEYRPLPISTDDFLRLKAAVGDRDPKLRLTLAHTDDGAGNVAVMACPPFRGVDEKMVIASVEHVELSPNLTEGRWRPIRDGSNAKVGWIVYYPGNGMSAVYEFVAVAEVANFLAFGDTQACRRSSTKTRRARPAAKVREEIVTDAQGSKEDVVQHGGAGSRRRYLPMLGSRAGE
jgi:hypothetical protein